MDINNINDLDLVFFCGNNFVSRGIVFLEKLKNKLIGGKLRNIKYAHVGIVISKKYIVIDNDDPPETKYIIESILSSDCSLFGDGVPDASGGYFFGVQARNLDEVINSNIKRKSSIGYTSIKNKEYLDNYLDKFNTIFQKYNHLNFPIDILRPFNALLPYNNFDNCSLFNFDFIACKKKKTMFCSEFVSYVLDDLKLIDVIPEKIVPSDLLEYCNEIIVINQ